MSSKIGLLSLFLTIAACAPCSAECPKWERLSLSAQKSFEAGDYNKAAQIWIKAASEAEFCNPRDPNVPLSYKRLGECFLKGGNFVDAQLAFDKADAGFKLDGTNDTELSTDRVALAKVYKSIDFTLLSKGVADAFKESGVNLIGVCKIDQGNKVQMNLNDKFVKQVENADVDQVSLEKLVSFEVFENPDSTLRIKNIKGLKVHARNMWVTILESQVRPQDPSGASADVTATKMGFTKTVSCKLPSDSIEPMNTLIRKLHDFNNELASLNAPTSPPVDQSAPSTSNSVDSTNTPSGINPASTSNSLDSTSTSSGINPASTPNPVESNTSSDTTPASAPTTSNSPSAPLGSASPQNVNPQPTDGAPADTMKKDAKPEQN
ncbi:MAG TPA: hypothetical protein V6C76_10140 [Drouetiella sp.]